MITECLVSSESAIASQSDLGSKSKFEQCKLKFSLFLQNYIYFLYILETKMVTLMGTFYVLNNL